MLQNVLRSRYFLNSLRSNSWYKETFHDYFVSISDIVKSSHLRNHWEEKINHSAYQVENVFTNFDQCIDELIQYCDQFAESKFDEYNKSSIELYSTMKNDLIHPKFNFETPVTYDYPDKILNRRMPISSEERQAVVERIIYHSSWEYPGMIIRPGLENFIDHMVPSDPLYLVDHIPQLLQPATLPFPEQYRRRLRLYTIDDESVDVFYQLPKKQFSLVMVWYFFEFKPLHVVEKYLEQIYNLLRPGGVVAFSLNDCDYGHNVGLVDNKFCCFTPGSKVINHSRKIGYELFYEYHTVNALHWFELKKPGTLTTYRGGQSLAKIIPLQ
jgi:hypothetical protein